MSGYSLYSDLDEYLNYTSVQQDLNNSYLIVTAHGVHEMQWLNAPQLLSDINCFVGS